MDGAWTTVQAFQSLITQMRRHGVDGGSFWRWINYNALEDADPTLSDPVKRRGVVFSYNPIQSVLAQLYRTP